MRVLAVDDANDARSQIAEGWARALSAPGVEAYSAGLAPRRLRPEVVAVMREVGIDVSSQVSKPLGGLPAPDVVVDLGDEPAPVQLGTRRVVWSTPDPCGVTTSDPLAPFRVARDEIGARIAAFLAQEGHAVQFGEAVRGEFLLQPGIAFLNHGSFGATPRSVLAAQTALREELESQPVRFMLGVGPRIRRAAGAVAAVLRANPDGVVFVDNASMGTNTVLRSFDWSPSDVIVTTNQAYGAVEKSLGYLHDRYGVQIRRIVVPYPVRGPGDVVQAVRDQWPAERVKLAVFDHITSATGAVWPVAELTELAHEQGAQVLIDGAHAPGQVPLDLTALGADYWVGNCHKWLFAPKGCAVLYVAREHRAALHPLVISHGYGGGLTEEFDWTGTKDPTPWLSVEAALDFVQRQGGHDRIRAHNVALRAAGARTLEREVGLMEAAPATMLAALETRPLPNKLGTDHLLLSRRMWEEHGVEAVVVPFDGRLWVRISAQIYNTPDDYERLAAALLERLAHAG